MYADDTSITYMSTLERNPIIEINQFPIKQVPTSKSLGVYIDGIFLVSVILTKSQRRLLLALVRFSVLGIFSLLRFYLTYTINWYSHTLITAMWYGGIVPRTYLLNCRNCRITSLAFQLSLIMTAVLVNYLKI